METIKLRLWEVEERGMALLVSTTPKAGRDGKQAWIPKSQLEHVSRLVVPLPGEWREIEVTIPLWLAEQKGLA